MSRFFVEKSQISGNKLFITDADDIKHISKVLRLSAGSVIEVSDSEQFEYNAVIENVSKESVECIITDKQRFLREPETKVTLFQGIPKQGKMDTIVQKSVELGVNQIVPMFTARSVIVDKGNFEKKTDRWQKISDEAVKQCRRGIIPQVRKPIHFKELVSVLAEEVPFDLILFLYENEVGTTIKHVLQEYKASNARSGCDEYNGGKSNGCSVGEGDEGNGCDNVCDGDEGSGCGNVCDEGSGGSDKCGGNIAIIIGPEGGFSNEEAEEALRMGAKSASLGKTVLRTETAGAAALAMIMYELEL